MYGWINDRQCIYLLILSFFFIFYVSFYVNVTRFVIVFVFVRIRFSFLGVNKRFLFWVWIRDLFFVCTNCIFSVNFQISLSPFSLSVKTFPDSSNSVVVWFWLSPLHSSHLGLFLLLTTLFSIVLQLVLSPFFPLSFTTLSKNLYNVQSVSTKNSLICISNTVAIDNESWQDFSQHCLAAKIK